MKLTSHSGIDHGAVYASPHDKFKKKMQRTWGKVTCLCKTVVDSPVWQASMPFCSSAGNVLAFAQEISPLVASQSNSLAETAEVFGGLGDIFQQARKVRVLSLARVGFIGLDCYYLSQEWKEASKPRDYGKAFLATLSVVQDTIDLPERIINIVDMFEPAVKAASDVAAWAPWLSLISTAMSLGSIALGALRLWETDKFTKNMRNTCELALVKYIRDLKVAGSSVYQVSLAKALESLAQAESVVKLKQLKAELSKNDCDSGVVADLIETLEQSSSDNASLLIEVNRQIDLGNKSGRQLLKKAVEKELQHARNARDAIPLNQVIRDLKNELRELRPESMQALEELANVAYIEKLKNMNEKVLERHFQVDGKTFKASIERIWHVYQNTVGNDHDTAVYKLEKAVAILKGRISESKMFHIWSIVARIVALIASIIFLALSFGVVCAPLAPIAYILMACLGITSIIKIFIEYQRKRAFEEQIGMTEYRLCTSWEARLEKKLKKAEGKIQGDLIKLQQKIADRDFKVACSILKADSEASNREKKNILIYNQLVGEINSWRKKHYIQGSGPL